MPDVSLIVETCRRHEVDARGIGRVDPGLARGRAPVMPAREAKEGEAESPSGGAAVTVS